MRVRLRDHLASLSMVTQPWANFIHVIRNGFDIAYSSDRNQLRWFGDLISERP
jgi:hypothetical protein